MRQSWRTTGRTAGCSRSIWSTDKGWATPPTGTSMKPGTGAHTPISRRLSKTECFRRPSTRTAVGAIRIALRIGCSMRCTTAVGIPTCSTTPWRKPVSRTATIIFCSTAIAKAASGIPCSIPFIISRNWTRTLAAPPRQRDHFSIIFCAWNKRRAGTKPADISPANGIHGDIPPSRTPLRGVRGVRRWSIIFATTILPNSIHLRTSPRIGT